MVDIKNRLQTAQWILERNLAWIAAADAKAAVIVTLNTAMVGGLATLYSVKPCVTSCTKSFLALSLIIFFTIVYCTTKAVFPRLIAPKQSLVFFGEINKLKPNYYINKIATAKDEELLADWTMQIHRNAEIASQKFYWIKYATILSIFFAIAWSCTIFLLSIS